MTAGLASALCLGGCVFTGSDSEDDRPARPGELGAGNFRYICVGDSDPFCEDGAVASTFPERFAIGGRFDLAFEPEDNFFFDNGVIPRVIAPVLGAVQTEAMTFQFLREGYSAFIARDNEGAVIDIRHLYAAPVARIAVTTDSSQDLAMIELGVGQDQAVDALPQDDFRSTLAGSLDYVWSTDDPTVAEVITADFDTDISIRANAVGETTLRIVTGAFEQTLTIVVTEDAPPDPTTESDTDASDTDAPDTDASDTDAPDTDAPDTDASDTDASDTDATDTDTDATDTDTSDTDPTTGGME